MDQPIALGHANFDDDDCGQDIETLFQKVLFPVKQCDNGHQKRKTTE